MEWNGMDRKEKERKEKKRKGKGEGKLMKRKEKERKGKKRKENKRNGKEMKGKERKGKERQGKKWKEKERKGKERKDNERKGKERKGKTRNDFSVLTNDCSVAGLAMATGPLSQVPCFTIALLCAREFSRGRRNVIEQFPHPSELQEQAVISASCGTSVAQGWSHLGVISGILVGVLIGVSLSLWPFTLSAILEEKAAVASKQTWSPARSALARALPWWKGQRPKSESGWRTSI